MRIIKSHVIYCLASISIAA